MASLVEVGKDARGQDRSLATWIALNQWVSEGIPFAGEAFRQMIHDLIQRNKLVKGEFRLRGARSTSRTSPARY